MPKETKSTDPPQRPARATAFAGLMVRLTLALMTVGSSELIYAALKEKRETKKAAKEAQRKAAEEAQRKASEEAQRKAAEEAQREAQYERYYCNVFLQVLRNYIFPEGSMYEAGRTCDKQCKNIKVDVCGRTSSVIGLVFKVVNEVIYVYLTEEDFEKILANVLSVDRDLITKDDIYSMFYEYLPDTPEFTTISVIIGKKIVNAIRSKHCQTWRGDLFRVSCEHGNVDCNGKEVGYVI